MKMINQVKFTFFSRSVNESFARAALAAFLAQADPTVPRLFRHCAIYCPILSFSILRPHSLRNAHPMIFNFIITSRKGSVTERSV